MNNDPGEYETVRSRSLDTVKEAIACLSNVMAAIQEPAAREVIARLAEGLETDDPGQAFTCLRRAVYTARDRRIKKHAIAVAEKELRRIGAWGRAVELLQACS